MEKRIRRAIAGLLRISAQLREDDFLTEQDAQEIADKAESIRSKLMEIAKRYDPMEDFLKQKHRQ